MPLLSSPKTKNPFKSRLLCEYCTHVFGGIVEGKAPGVALGLKRGRGRPKKNTFERDVLIALYMRVAMHKWGKTWLEAKGDAASHFFPEGGGDKAAEAAYSKFCCFLDEHFDEAVAFFEEFKKAPKKPEPGWRAYPPYSLKCWPTLLSAVCGTARYPE